MEFGEKLLELVLFFDMEFYERLGFRKKYHCSFFWKKDAPLLMVSVRQIIKG